MQRTKPSALITKSGKLSGGYVNQSITEMTRSIQYVASISWYPEMYVIDSYKKLRIKQFVKDLNKYSP